MKELLASLISFVLMLSGITVFAADMSPITNALCSNSEPVTFKHQGTLIVDANDAGLKPIQDSTDKAVSGEKVKIIPLDGIQINIYDPNQEFNMSDKAPVKDNLTMADIESLKLGMRRAEVERILGPAHECVGSGILRHVYYLNDGTSIRLTYAREKINYEEELVDITVIGKDGKTEKRLSKQDYGTGVPSEQPKALLSKENFAFLRKGMEYSEVFKHVGLGKYKTYGDIISYDLEDGTNIELVFSANGLDYVQITDCEGNIIQKLFWDSRTNNILIE